VLATAPPTTRDSAQTGAHRAATTDDTPASLDALAFLMRSLPRGPLLTAEQEEALVRRLRGEDVRVPPPGDPCPSPRQAHDRLVEENLRLVISVARKYRNRGLPLEDMVQEGALALRRAAQGFDPAQGRFAPYAVLWVREAIVRALTQDGRAVRVPSRVSALIGQVASTDERLRGKLGRDPSSDEIARELGLSALQVEELRRAARRPLSIDGLGPGDEPAPGPSLVDPGPPPEVEAEQRWMHRDVRRMLAALAPRERRILALRFGIGQERSHSSTEVGTLLGITRRQAERLEMQALTQLRSSKGVRDLLVYLR
jgi:RNA polymerase primary sigma factor